ncbi:MAG: AlpA family phage regulatory protein [Magnetococcales bacterium]|nr:AlpA family phage regulatory protein [Magnetococcales bacterium]
MTLWRLREEGIFPVPIKIGRGKNIGWFEDEIRAWQEGRPRAGK